MTDLVPSIQNQIERDYRWNFAVNALDGASFWFGMSFISSTIILPLFVSHFTDNPLVFGLIPFLGWAGVLIPSIFMANAVERAPLKMFFPVTIGFYSERLPLLLLAPLTYLLAVDQPVLCLAVFFLLYTWHNFGAGFITVGWQDMIAKIFPVDRRGRFFGITNFIGNGSGILGALAVPFVLERFAYPMGFVYAFAVAGILIFISWVFLSLTREPPVYSSKPPVSQQVYLRSLPQALRGDPNFRRYLLAQIVFAFSGMATGFLLVYTLQTWNLSDVQGGIYMIALQVGLVLANPFFGFLADRTGHKLSLEICWILNVVLRAGDPGSQPGLVFRHLFPARRGQRWDDDLRYFDCV